MCTEDSENILIEYYCEIPLLGGECIHKRPPYNKINCEDWHNTKCRNGACYYTKDIKGDIDDNRKVNILDIAAMAIAYGTKPEDPRWNRNADLNNDETINIIDIAMVARNFGNDCSCKQGTYNSKTGKWF
ncbi:MAG: dockerin type I domain-containing protein [Candidatus Aenigmarchaeota archaeon]|nr:dockerin type I domain-containing protein [Candidatus Aenigmarchaeota archaeon]